MFGKYLVFLALLFFGSIIAHPNKVVKKRNNGNTLVKYEYNDLGAGSYIFRYQTMDGALGEENAKITKNSVGQVVKVVRGTYSFKTPNGRWQTISYNVDRTSFKPDGVRLRTSFRRNLSQTDNDNDAEVADRIENDAEVADRIENDAEVADRIDNDAEAADNDAEIAVRIDRKLITGWG